MTGWPSYSAFVRDRLVLGGTLVVPARVVWRGYLAYCEGWSFDPATAGEFMRWLSAEEGVKLNAGGRGRLRRYFSGVGFAGSSSEGIKAA